MGIPSELFRSTAHLARGKLWNCTPALPRGGHTLCWCGGGRRRQRARRWNRARWEFRSIEDVVGMSGRTPNEQSPTAEKLPNSVKAPEPVAVERTIWTPIHVELVSWQMHTMSELASGKARPARVCSNAIPGHVPELRLSNSHPCGGTCLRVGSLKSWKLFWTTGTYLIPHALQHRCVLSFVEEVAGSRPSPAAAAARRPRRRGPRSPRTARAVGAASTTAQPQGPPFGTQGRGRGRRPWPVPPRPPSVTWEMGDGRWEGCDVSPTPPPDDALPEGVAGAAGGGDGSVDGKMGGA
eukprot:gene17780-biopygen15936